MINKYRLVTIIILLALCNALAFSGAMARYRSEGDADCRYIDDISTDTMLIEDAGRGILVSFSSDGGASWSDEVEVELIARDNPRENLVVSWTWEEAEGAQYRYSIDGDGWKAGRPPVIDEVKPNTLSIISIESSNDGISWSGTSSKGVASIDRRYRHAASISLMANTAFRVATFGDGEPSVPAGGGGGRAMLAFPVSDRVSLALDADCNALCYGAVPYAELSVEGKIRYTGRQREGLSLFIQIGGGESLAWSEGRLACYPMASADFGFQRMMGEGISLDAALGYYASFQRDGVNHGARLSIGTTMRFGKGARI